MVSKRLCQVLSSDEIDPGSDLPGTYTVTFPDVPEAITQGENLADAKLMAADALETILRTYIERGEELPPVKTRSGKNAYWIEASALAQNDRRPE